MIPEQELFRIRVQVDLLPNPIRHRVATEVVLEKRDGNYERHDSSSVVFDESDELCLSRASR